jgi:membrane-associated phospholipid phosphatase
MIRCIFFILLISTGSQAWAQSTANSRSDTAYFNSDSATKAVLANTSGIHIIWHDIKDGFYELGQYVLRPFNWDLREWGIIATGIGFTAILETADDVPLRNIIQSNKGKFGDQFVEFGNDFYGDGIATGLTFVSLYSIGLSTDNDKLRTMGVHVIESFAYAGLTTTALKIIVGRNRPFLYQGKFIYNGPSLANAANSMPSGHVTVASALSESLASDLDNTWASVALYSFVAWTAYSRIYVDAHWLSDTFLAGVIGICSGYWVAHQPDHYDMKTNDPKPTSFDIEPTVNGLSLAYHF